MNFNLENCFKNYVLKKRLRNKIQFLITLETEALCFVLSVTK